MRKLTLFIAVFAGILLLGIGAGAQPGIITRMAGGGVGDGNLATNAGLHQPSGIVTDSSGNIYVSDQYNHRIRKISTSGVISTVAGNCYDGLTESFRYEGALATSAVLTIPRCIAIDSRGVIYFVDYDRVLKIDSSGRLRTVAGNGYGGFSGDGGPATAASLLEIDGIAIDRRGNIYISDAGNQRIRKVSTSGFITTIAGNGFDTTGFGTYGGEGGYSGDEIPATTARLSMPCGITVDRIGNVYFADEGNQRIRKIDTNGIINTIAGTGFDTTIAGFPSFYGGFSGDGGQATLAELNSPNGVAIDSSGNVFICDMGNSRIRKVNTSGIITTVVGGGTSTITNGSVATAVFGGVKNICIDVRGNIYFNENPDNSRIIKVNSTGIINIIAGGDTYSGDSGMATLAELYQPTAIAADAIGNTYIVDEYNLRIRKVNTSGIINTIAGAGTGSGIGDGGPATAVSGIRSAGIATDMTDNLYLSDLENNLIRKIDRSGTITTIAGGGSGGLGDGGPATNASLGYPFGVAVDIFGNIIFSDQSNDRIRKVNPSGTITTIAGNGTFGYSGDGGSAVLAKLSYPGAVCTDRFGNIYFVDQGNFCVRKINSSGIITTVAGNGTFGLSPDGTIATAAQLTNCNGIAVDISGNIYIYFVLYKNHKHERCIKYLRWAYLFRRRIFR